MPKQYDEPVSLKQTLTPEDYTRAFARVTFFAAPMKRRSVRTLVCVTAAAVAASFLPLCGGRAVARDVAAILAAVFAVAAASVWFLQPVLEKTRAEQWFRSCPLATLPSEITLTREGAVIVTECERITEYWTDFSFCVETESFLAAAGGRERFLLVLKKDGLPPEEVKKLSDLMHYVFEGRWAGPSFRKGGS